MLQSVSTNSRHYPQERGARFAEVGGRFTGMPRMTLRLRYLTLKLRAARAGSCGASWQGCESGVRCKANRTQTRIGSPKWPILPL